MARARGPAPRRFPHRARGQHRQRPHPHDRAGPGNRPDLRAVGDVDLLPRIRRAAHHLRRALGSHRPQADVHDRHGDLHRLQPARGRVAERRHAHLRPRGRGRRRRDDAAHVDGDHQRQLPRPHARSSVRPVGRGLRWHGRLRSTTRRLARRRRLLALGVLHQCPARPHQSLHGVVRRRRVQGRRQEAPRHRRRLPVVDRPGPGRLRPHRGPGTRLVDAHHVVGSRTRVACPR